MARFRRKDLKRPDPFVSTTRRAFDWAEANRNQVQLGVLAIVLVAVGIAAATSISNSRQRQANEEVVQGLTQLRNENFAEAGKTLGEVAERWGGSGVGAVAQLFAAQAALSANDGDKAGAVLTKVAALSFSDPALSQQAKLAAATAAEQRGDVAKAADGYAAARATGGPYGAVALLGEARCRERAGALAEARKLYQSFTTEYPQSGDQAYVASHLASLPAA